MGNFFIIYDRQEGSPIPLNVGPTSTSPIGKPPEVGSAKVLPAKVKTSETAGRWSGNPETAKVVLIEATTALEARQSVNAFFPGSSPTAVVSVAEGSFVENA